MTLAKIIDTLKMIALKHPNVNSAYEGNIYDILNAKPDNRYASVVITQQSHTTDEIYDHYGFVIFYVDRLVDDLEENRVQIQSIGKSMLGNIITAFCNEFEAECENISYQTFTQRFADETAGVYCTITIDTVKDVYCAERYWDESWSAPVVSIKNVDMSITITENGHYVLDYDPTTHTGIGKVDIDVELNTEPYYNDGYENGYNVGRNVGYNNGYRDGYDGGKQEVMESAQDITITENGEYGDGETLYKTIDVNIVPKIDIAKEGITFAYSTIKELPKWADFSNATSLRYMFALNNVMTEAPYMDTNKVTNWENCFWSMYQLKTAPNYDTENATKVRGMFSTCHNLETPPTYLNLLKCEDMQEMFYDVRLKDYSFLANWDINPKANMGSMITAYDYVEYIPAIPNEGATDFYQSGIIQSWADFSKLTYFGGYIGRKYNLTSTSVLPKCPNLTYESCISILNNLYDFVANGETPQSNQGQLKVHPNFLTTVGDDITIGTNKGWIITA